MSLIRQTWVHYFDVGETRDDQHQLDKMVEQLIKKYNLPDNTTLSDFNIEIKNLSKEDDKGIHVQYQLIYLNESYYELLQSSSRLFYGPPKMYNFK